jgi:hypothetical protein
VILYIKRTKHCTSKLKKRLHQGGKNGAKITSNLNKDAKQSFNEKLNPSCFNSELMKQEVTLKANLHRPNEVG